MLVVFVDEALPVDPHIGIEPFVGVYQLCAGLWVGGEIELARIQRLQQTVVVSAVEIAEHDTESALGVGHPEEWQRVQPLGFLLVAAPVGDITVGKVGI